MTGPPSSTKRNAGRAPGDFGIATTHSDTQHRTASTAVAQRDAVFGATPSRFHVIATRAEGRRTVVFVSSSGAEAQAAADAHQRFALATGANVSISVEQDALHVVGVRR